MANTFKFGNENWAVKDGKVLAYNDENNAFKPLPFTFARSSSATRVDNEGLIKTTDSGFARIDFLNNTKGHLLLEPSRTNLVTYSEDFSQSVWGTWQATKTQSNKINPKGTNGYYEISHTGSSSDNPNTRLVNVSLNGSYTLSFFVKINQSRYISLAIEDYDGERAKVYFDTINKTFTTINNVGSPITNTNYSEFSNDWIRISLSVNLLNAVYNEVGIGMYNPSGSFPSSSGEVISIFGGQLEEGSYATSYIPTEGSAVTRSAETCNSAGNSTVFNDSEGVLYAELASLAEAVGNSKQFSISDGSNSNSIRFAYRNTNNEIQLVVRDGGTNTVNITTILSPSVTNFFKIAFKYKADDCALFVNGVKTNTDTSATMPSGLSTFNFDRGDGGNDYIGKVKNIQVYNTALTDAELIELTS
jgi:hypothetical protein